MKLCTQSRWSLLIINMIWYANFRSGCSPVLYRIAILKNFFGVIRMWWSHFSKSKPLSLKEVIEPFSMLKILRFMRKCWSFFPVSNTLKQWWWPFSALITLRNWVLKALKSRKTESILVVTLHYAFIWCTNFLEQHFLCQFPMNLFDYNNILISMKKDTEHISVNTVRPTFILHK